MSNSKTQHKSVTIDLLSVTLTLKTCKNSIEKHVVGPVNVNPKIPLEGSGLLDKAFFVFYFILF